MLPFGNPVQHLLGRGDRLGRGPHQGDQILLQAELDQLQAEAVEKRLLLLIRRPDREAEFRRLLPIHDETVGGIGRDQALEENAAILVREGRPVPPEDPARVGPTERKAPGGFRQAGRVHLAEERPVEGPDELGGLRAGLERPQLALGQNPMDRRVVTGDGPLLELPEGRVEEQPGGAEPLSKNNLTGEIPERHKEP